MSLIGGAESKVSLKGKIPVNQMKPKEIPYAGIDEATECGWYVADTEQFGEDMIQFDTMGVSRLLFRTDGDEQGDISQTAYLEGYVLRRYKSVFTGLWSEWKWENPPNNQNVEYRTTERYNGNPVYCQTFYVGTLANSGETTISHDLAISKYKFVRATAYAIHGEEYRYYPLPMISSDGNISAMILFGAGRVSIKTFTDLSAYMGKVTLYYTKL